MKKAFASYGLLGFVGLVILSASVLLMITRPATAQGNGDGNGLGLTSGPIDLASQPGQKFQINLAMFGRGQGTRPVRTTLDLYAEVLGPAGQETIRRTIVFPHVLDVSGKIMRISLVQSGDNLDLYTDGNLVKEQLLNGLPPGEPVIGFLMNTHTGTNDPSVTYMTGTVEVVAPDGHTIQAYKSHELSGHVTLMK